MFGLFQSPVQVINHKRFVMPFFSSDTDLLEFYLQNGEVMKSYKLLLSRNNKFKRESIPMIIKYQMYPVFNMLNLKVIIGHHPLVVESIFLTAVESGCPKIVNKILHIYSDILSASVMTKAAMRANEDNNTDVLNHILQYTHKIDTHFIVNSYVRENNTLLLTTILYNPKFFQAYFPLQEIKSNNFKFNPKKHPVISNIRDDRSWKPLLLYHNVMEKQHKHITSTLKKDCATIKKKICK